MANETMAGNFELVEQPTHRSPVPCPQGQDLATELTRIEMDGSEYCYSQPRQSRSPSLRRQSIALNTILHHRRALIGALFSGIGSNMSLPSCVNNEQEIAPSSTSMSNARGTQTHYFPSNRNNESDNQQKHSHVANLLQLTPVNTSSTPLNALETVQKDRFGNVRIAKNSALYRDQKLKHRAELISTISTLYAKLLVVVGIAVPVTASVSHRVPAVLNQGFYLYLYLVSVAFVVTMYTTLFRDKAVNELLIQRGKEEGAHEFGENAQKSRYTQTRQYGSFCLRLGAVGFGAGSLVFTGLQIGAEIASGGPFRAITPSARLLLVTAQMHFIFLNSKDLELAKHGALAKLGLMHMIATNLCEWLQALVEETRDEILELHDHEVSEKGLLKTLLRDASPFLFPCTIEFSLICAVILFEMWKRVDKKVVVKANGATRSLYQLSIDCSSAHRGLFGGILVIAATVLSLIMFFVLKESKPTMAIEQVTALETAILIAGALAALGGILKLRHLELKSTKPPPYLDSTLLAAAQAGVYLHCLFGAVGGVLTIGPNWGLSLGADFIALVQSTSQTLLVQIAWRRRTSSRAKPGKELITFLIVVNIALWTVNTLEKSRADVRPDHLRFFGVWAWTIITHVSMPLVIFFRFHSAICLFEVWKGCYKYRPPGVEVAPC
ncbi:proton channel OtopLc-like [Venturia canescens]|uniref:proton channel OtopLc-like n=1 Tax=Venturia canescens TaxID=32260 RepID=UPI001C9CEE2C|nr:proton channel OtopLc-like [Venturia canescens]